MMRERDGRDGPVDLSVLAPSRAPTDWAAFAARIETAARPELRRRSRLARFGLAEGVASTLVRFAGPALIAAAAAVVLAVNVARTTEPLATETIASVEALSDATVQQALTGVESGTSWIVEQRAPNTDDVVRSMLGDGERE